MWRRHRLQQLVAVRRSRVDGSILPPRVPCVRGRSSGDKIASGSVPMHADVAVHGVPWTHGILLMTVHYPLRRVVTCVRRVSRVASVA